MHLREDYNTNRCWLPYHTGIIYIATNELGNLVLKSSPSGMQQNPFISPMWKADPKADPKNFDEQNS